MDWSKVIFVMIIINRLDSIQNKVNDSGDINATKSESITTLSFLRICSFPNFEVLACLRENKKSIEINTNFTLNKLVNETKSNCTQLQGSNGLFFANLTNSNFCNLYNFSSDINNYYYIKGTDLMEVHNECPVKNKLCMSQNSSVETTTDTCPLNNFKATSIYDEYIRLNISWDKFEKDVSASIIIYPAKEGCHYEGNTYQSTLKNNIVIVPDSLPQVGIEPGCIYNISILPDDARENYMCLLNYQVPICVGSICLCDNFEPMPQILDVEHEESDVFNVKWDPGERSNGNYSYHIKDVTFSFIREDGDFGVLYETAREIAQNFKRNVTKISMKLFDGESYNLTGYFTNNFSCQAQRSFTFKAPDSSTFIRTLSAVIIALIILLFLLLINIMKSYIKKWKFILSFGRNATSDLTRLQADQIPMTSNIQYTPIEFLEGAFDEFEFPKNKLILKQIIGSGAFGQVYLAKANGIGGTEGSKIVAVKTLGERENITREATDDFIAEIKIFKKIGHHPNIVSLLGCCTLEPPYMMIMEFVPCGDLKNYLLDLREQWLKKKNAAAEKQFFFPDTSDGSYIEPATPASPTSITSSRFKFIFKTPPTTPATPCSPTSTRLIPVQETKFTFKTPPPTPTSRLSNHRSVQESKFTFKTPPPTPTTPSTELTSKSKLVPEPLTPESITSSRLPSTSETVSTILEGPEPVTPLLSELSKTLEKVLDHKELQNFALQIARGMAHLEKIPITHRDLAARNILISEAKVLKISDFGLSRTGPYINHKTKKLPLRWMALEAITEQKYDSKSDVWSFGVVLWEIGTLGAFPYENIPDSFILQFLQMGRRLDRPEICTDELYTLMKQCWASNPNDRPTFQELVDALDVKKRKIYVQFNQLNPTYVFPPSDPEKSSTNVVQSVDIDINEN